MGNRQNLLPSVTPVVRSGEKITRVAIVIDKSGSMADFKYEVPEQLKNQLKVVEEESEGATYVTLVDFNTGYNFLFRNYDKRNAYAYYYNFVPNGGTALNDAVGAVIKELEGYENIDDRKTDDWGYLVVVLTDGEENSSIQFSNKDIDNLISTKTKTGHWTFAFMVPSGSGSFVRNRYSLHKDNVVEWDLTKQGFEKVQQLNTQGTRSYLSARSAGEKAITTYFRTDLSGFDPDKKGLLDVTGGFKSYKVEKETDITSFYQYKTGQTYNPQEGKCFYQLTKKELIQPQKSLVVQDKRSKRIFGGDVRKALNMAPSQNGVNLKVDPGNHDNFDIFVQSTSPNRKLVRGTSVLVSK